MPKTFIFPNWLYKLSPISHSIGARIGKTVQIFIDQDLDRLNGLTFVIFTVKLNKTSWIKSSIAKRHIAGELLSLVQCESDRLQHVGNLSAFLNQTADICKPSSFCLRAVAAVVWRVVEITWQNSGVVVRSLRVSLNQELAADHFFWASSRTRSTCLWLLTVIFKGRCRLVRRDQSATMFRCVVHGKITSKTQGFPTEHHTLIWWLMYFTSPVEDFISGGLSKSRWTSFSCCLFCFLTLSK